MDRKGLDGIDWSWMHLQEREQTVSNIEESVEEAVAPKLVLLEESRRKAECLAAMYAHDSCMRQMYELEQQKLEAQIKGLMYNERWIYTEYYTLLALWLHGKDNENYSMIHDGSYMYPVFDICNFRVHQYSMEHKVEPWDSWMWHGR